jgi:uncharacterized protein
MLSRISYNAIKLKNAFLLINDCGEHCFLGEKSFFALEQNDFCNIPETTLLKSRLFICEEEDQVWLKTHIEQRKNVKRSFLYNPELLLMVVPTLSCNSRCIYCQANSVTDGNSVKNMSIKTALQFCKFVSGLPYSRIKVEFQGGEPTLRLSIIQLIVELLNRIPDKEISFVICTNLLDIDSDFVHFVTKHSINISTSLDGEKAIHDFQRPSIKGFSSHDSVIRNITLLRNAGVFPSALMTLTKESIDQLTNVIRYYVSLGFQSVFIRPLNHFGRAASNNEIQIPDGAFLKAYKSALDYLIQTNLESPPIKDEYTSILLRKILTPYSDGFTDLQNPCAYGSMCLLVNYDGNIYPCDEARMLAEMGDASWKISNVFEKNAMAKLEEYKEKISSFSLDLLSVCKECAFKLFCGANPIRLGQRGENHYCGIQKEIFITLFTLLNESNPRVLNLLYKWAHE